MGNCSNCRLKEVRFPDSLETEGRFIKISERMQGLCHGGKNETLKNFFKANDRYAELECFQPTEIEIRLTNAIELADKILDAVKESKNG